MSAGKKSADSLSAKLQQMLTHKEPVKPLWSEQLLARSQAFARLAMQDYLDNEIGNFYVHAGTAIELLTKAYLVDMDPALIVDGKSFDSLLHASGNGRHARTPATRIRTITVGEALDRCGQMVPSLANLRSDLQPLIDARNGAIHVGHVDDAEKMKMLVPYLRASGHLLDAGNHVSDEYWGQFKEIVELRVAEETEAAVTKAKEAIAGAKLRFEQKYGHLSDAVRPVVLGAIEQAYAVSRYDEQLVKCPACGTLGVASGSIDVDWVPEFEEEEGQVYVGGVDPVVTFFPAFFSCRACELELTSDDELAAAEMDESWELDDIDPADFVGDDYDDYP